MIPQVLRQGARVSVSSNSYAHMRCSMTDASEVAGRSPARSCRRRPAGVDQGQPAPAIFPLTQPCKLTAPCCPQTIHDELVDIIPERQELAKKLKSQYGDAKLGDVTVNHVFGGMRGLKAMLWDPSVLDSEEGIRFWGKSIPECQQVLPAAKDGEEMLPESMFWFLLTGKVPSREQVDAFTADLAERSTKVPKFVEDLVDSLRGSWLPYFARSQR